jgi:RNA polymerase sigma-70 factor (ECF subfamily)
MSVSTESIWNACADKLRLFISKRVSGSSVVDDILQDVFIKIHENIDTIKDDAKISSWIYQITRNSIIDYYRKNKVRFADINSFPENELNALHDADPLTENEYEKHIASGLQKMINALPEKYAQALYMVEINGMSQVELAKKLKISPSGAKSRVQRGRTMLKDSLMNCCHYEFDKYGTIISYHPIKCCCCHQYSEEKKTA